MKITIVGTGYVGLVSGVCLAEVGHDVCCVDRDETKIRMLKDGKSPIFEPGLEKLIQSNLAAERLSFSTDLHKSVSDRAVVFIAVGTPEDQDGSADLSHVRAVAKEVAQHLVQDTVVVVKSTVPVGTCDEVESLIKAELATNHKAFKVAVVSNPEFLKEGGAVEDFMKPDRIICGFNEDAPKEILEEIYKPFVLDDPGRLLMVDRRSSELAKYGANAMLATRISFMNELSRLCEKVGANIDNVRLGMGSDPRIGKKFLYAGPGYGGSCFPKDVQALLHSGKKNDIEFLVLNAVDKANKAQIKYVSKKITSHFKDLNGKKIAVWGLAFKPGTDDVREAPAMTIIQDLLAQGATVVGHDPEAAKNFTKHLGNPERFSCKANAYDALKGANALVLVTEWPIYRRPNWEKVGAAMAEKVVFDFRNQYDFDDLAAQGFFYRSVGRPDSVQSTNK